MFAKILTKNGKTVCDNNISSSFRNYYLQFPQLILNNYSLNIIIIFIKKSI